MNVQISLIHNQNSNRTFRGIEQDNSLDYYNFHVKKGEDKNIKKTSWKNYKAALFK